MEAQPSWPIPGAPSGETPCEEEQAAPRCRRFCLYTECCRNDLILQWSLYFSLVDVNLTRLHPRHRNTNRKLQGSTTPLQGLEVPMCYGMVYDQSPNWERDFL
ncbi:Hypothetical predicted protein [Podarcis lilfordi]|uniref:Uncharacterized protein n=1 Tax=Podarcis lilfordi TaxID=74358 RepID=A0AA35JXW9_9SAUR|nr:Hypothetical predicted protein [Podarcis lilfordi]